MGNALRFKEQKNSDRGNIKMCEKRYGYNLNDLHSYIYKINLPLKPAYIHYILEDKKRHKSTHTQTEGEKEKEKEREDEPLEITNDKYIDLYKKYEKDNINNTNNIYKNQLTINNGTDVEKIEDKYIHFSYNPAYKYDSNKNNIYTGETISDYVGSSNKNTCEIMQKKIQHMENPQEGQGQGQGQGQEQEQEHIMRGHSNAYEIHKTYTNMCLNYYNNLDTCVIKKYEKNVQNKKYKFTRLHTCKPHYVMFSRCIRYRDKKLMHQIKKMEMNYFKKLNDQSKSSYLNEFLTNLSYHEYLISRLYDGVEKIKLNKELNELRERYNHILKETELLDVKNKKNVHRKKQTTQNHRHILLNIQ